jgi:PhnB protein
MQANHPPATFQLSFELHFAHGLRDIPFYTEALGAIETQRFCNDDGSLHVLELSLNGIVFHLHENNGDYRLTPPEVNGVTTTLEIWTAEPDALFAQAIAAGAVLLSPMQDYEYGYRQGEFQDPLGYRWIVQCRI